MPNGYTGKVLRVNLSTGDIGIEEHDDAFYRRYGGGAGIIAHNLLSEVPPDADALGSDNNFIAAAGVLTGNPLGGSGRNAFGGKSPLTGGFGEGDVGGYFGAELKRAGWDAVIVSGVADRPVYIAIDDDKAEIKDADGVWGLTTGKTEDALREELGDKKYRFAVCGPAGEKLVRVACVIVDKNRAAGRTGLGAVMGSKKLKAIAVRGSENVTVADPDTTREMARWVSQAWKERSGGLQPFGTAGGVKSLHDFGGLPTHNFELGHFDNYGTLTGQHMADTILVGNDTCYACPIRCKREVEVTDDDRFEVSREYGGPEYETIGAVASNCDVDDLNATARANQICNEYGMDTIGAGMCVSSAMEWWEKGLIDAGDTGGLEMSFGSAHAMVTMMQQLADREGFGDVIAEGVHRAAEAVGGGAVEEALTIKGQELPMHEPKFKIMLGIGYAVSPTGADHNHSTHDTLFGGDGWNLDRARGWGVSGPLEADEESPEKYGLAFHQSNFRWAQNALGMCAFLPWDPQHLVDITSAATGWKFSQMEYQALGQRVQTMARLYNTLVGFTAADDTLPPRLFRAFESGPLEGYEYPREWWEQGKKVFYSLMGWGSDGIPTREGLMGLGLGEFVDKVPAVA